MKSSKKVNMIEPSKTLAINKKARLLKEEGKSIIDFSIGEPDFETPKYIMEGACEGLKKGFTKYTEVAGIAELRDEVAKKFTNDKGVETKRENVIVSPGAKFSIYISLLALLDKGDEVLIPSPYWTSYPEMVQLNDGIPVIVETKESNGYKLDIEILNEYLTNKTKVLILTNPSNPSGIVYDRQTLLNIGNWALENNVYIISDEIYDELVYDRKHICISSLSDEIKNNTIIINGMSKAYAMTGWRIGYAIANKEIISKMSSAQSHISSNATAISQYASYIALRDETENKDTLQAMYSEFQKRRDKIIELLDKANVKYIKPEGAFYVMIDVRDYLNDTTPSSAAFAEGLLNNKGVALTPGEAFGIDGYIRISYANSMENVVDGVNKIIEYTKEI